MPENLPDHTHCLECDSALPWGSKFCSPACEEAHQAKSRRERNRNLLFIVVAIVAVILLALLSALA